MADKPIIFSAPMVRALMDWRKTQTRRVLKVQPPEPCEFAGFYSVPLSGAFQCRFQGDTTIYTQRLPYAPGDRLYVREHWRTADAYDDLSPSQMGGEESIIYLADDTLETWGWRNDFVPGRFRQAMHMPRWASRLTLTVTDVRVQRLQDISEDDARAEGVSDEWSDYEEYGQSQPYRYGFSALWNSLHGPDAWDANPWVAAYTFAVQHGNIDTQGDPQ